MYGDFPDLGKAGGGISGSVSGSGETESRPDPSLLLELREFEVLLAAAWAESFFALARASASVCGRERPF